MKLYRGVGNEQSGSTFVWFATKPELARQYSSFKRAVPKVVEWSFSGKILDLGRAERRDTITAFLASISIDHQAMRHRDKLLSLRGKLKGRYGTKAHGWPTYWFKDKEVAEYIKLAGFDAIKANEQGQVTIGVPRDKVPRKFQEDENSRSRLAGQIDSLLSETRDESKLLYHITYLTNVEDIASAGLKPGQGQTFGGAYTGHSKGRVFLTEWSGVRYWFGKYEEFASDKSDDPLEDGLVPVALRIESSGLDLQEDTIGTRDARSKSYFIESRIPPNNIAGYDGRSWKPVKSLKVDRMAEVAEDAADIEEYDGERIVWPDLDVFLPRRG